MSTYNERMQKLVGAYREQGGEWPATSHEMSAWVINHELWKPQNSEIINICAEQLARAIKEGIITI
jgi:hypothetical protein